ncbi:MAG TPA: O-antigen ligase family protein [Candidatus Bipolaricaulota bacterium]|nr:O-antigen ligase family protein [Candidatus Bipolaricaulota bacterium]
MSKIKSPNPWQIILDSLLIGILIIVPLIYSSKLYNSFRLLKTTTFIALVCLVLIAAAIVFAEKKYLLWKNYKWPLILLGGFLLVKIIACIFSANPFTSFWGNYSKLEGVFTWLFYILYFFILCFNAIKSNKRNIYLFTIIAATFIQCVVGLLQYAGKIGSSWSASVNLRPIGTLGNTIHLSALMMFTIPLSLWGVFKFKNILLKMFSLATLVLQLFTLLFTNSRSSWAAMFISCLAIGLLYFIKISRNKKKLTIFLLSAIVLVGSFVYLAIYHPDATGNPYVKRALSVFNTEDLSNKQRLYFWQGSWDAFLARPLTGWGDDNLSLAFDRNYPPKLTDLPETKIDRAHNVFLDILVANGIFALLFLVAFLSYIFYLSCKLFSSESKEKAWLGAIGMYTVIGFIAQYFFMYPVISTYILIFFIFSQVVSAALVKNSLSEVEEKKLSTSKKLLLAGAPLIIFLLVLILVLIPRIRANMAFTRAQKTENGLFYREEAHRLWPSAQFTSSLVAADIRNTIRFAKENLEVAQNSLNSAYTLLHDDLKKHPDNYLSYISLGSIHNLFGEFGKADFYFGKAIELAPTRHELYWAWAENVLGRLKSGQDETYKDQIIKIMKKATEIDPNVALPYYKLSLVYDRLGMPQEADEYYRLAMEKGLLPRYIVKPVGDATSEANDYFSSSDAANNEDR